MKQRKWACKVGCWSCGKEEGSSMCVLQEQVRVRGLVSNINMGNSPRKSLVDMYVPSACPL